MNASSLENVLDRVKLVVFQTRIVTPVRDTGEGVKTGSRIEKVLQSCFDPAALKPLTRKKQEATRICRSFGTKVETLNAWAVPIERTEDLINQLSKIAEDWNLFAQDLADNMEGSVEAWIQANPSEAAAIRALAPSRDDVLKSTRFIHTSFRIRGEDVEDSGCLETELDGLAGQTLYELATALRDSSLDKSSGGQYTQSVKDVLKRLEVKASSLAFLNPRVAEVAGVLKSTIAMLPDNGMITDGPAVLVKSVVDQMLNPGKLLKYGFSKISTKEAAPQPASKPVAKPATKPAAVSAAQPADLPVAQEVAQLAVQPEEQTYEQYEDQFDDQPIPANHSSTLPTASMNW